MAEKWQPNRLHVRRKKKILNVVNQVCSVKKGEERF